MNEQYEYLPVPEFAERAGVSKQAVYSRVKSGGIDEYVTEIGGKKHISTAALTFFAPRQVENQEQTTSPENLMKVDGKIDGKVDDQEQPTTDKLIGELIEEIRSLRGQLTEQSRQEEELRQQVKEKDEKLMEYADKFAELSRQTAELADKAISTTGQAQILHAHAVSEDDPETVIIGPMKESTKINQSQPTKNNFLSRIFKKRVK